MKREDRARHAARQIREAIQRGAYRSHENTLDLFEVRLTQEFERLMEWEASQCALLAKDQGQEQLAQMIQSRSLGVEQGPRVQLA
jgi:hypothetical protein